MDGWMDGEIERVTEWCKVTGVLELDWHNMNKLCNWQRKKRENKFLTTATLYYLSSPEFVFKAVRSVSIFRRLTVVEMTLECLYMPLQSRREETSHPNPVCGLDSRYGRLALLSIICLWVPPFFKKPNEDVSFGVRTDVVFRLLPLCEIKIPSGDDRLCWTVSWR